MGHVARMVTFILSLCFKIACGPKYETLNKSKRFWKLASSKADSQTMWNVRLHLPRHARKQEYQSENHCYSQGFLFFFFSLPRAVFQTRWSFYFQQQKTM